jgi:hypothetical protein
LLRKARVEVIGTAPNGMPVTPLDLARYRGGGGWVALHLNEDDGSALVEDGALDQSFVVCRRAAQDFLGLMMDLSGSHSDAYRESLAVALADIAGVDTGAPRSWSATFGDPGQTITAMVLTVEEAKRHRPMVEDYAQHRGVTYLAQAALE